MVRLLLVENDSMNLYAKNNKQKNAMYCSMA